MTRNKKGVALTMEENKQIQKEVSQGLRLCIQEHGPIDKEWIGSATKRIVRHLNRRKLLNTKLTQENG